MFNEAAKRIYDFNVTMGWHKDAPDLAKYLMNLHEEVSELWSAWRDGKVSAERRCVGADPTLGCNTHAMGMPEANGMCHIYNAEHKKALCDKADKMIANGIHPLTCLEEELADILIRTLDTAHAFGIDIDRAVEAKMAYNATRGHRYGGKLA